MTDIFIKKSLEFQIYDWCSDHEKHDEDDYSDSEDIPVSKYIIHVFGRCEDGKSVYMKLLNYKPYFYLGLPWDEKKARTSISHIKKYLESVNKWEISKNINSLVDITFEKKKTTEGFTNDKIFYYAKLIFNNAWAMRKFRSHFEEQGVSIYKIKREPIYFKTYEANLPPMLRCFHIRNISGCSWVKVDKYDEVTKNKVSYCDIEINTEWDCINPIKKDFNAPLRIASFDIECFSHDGQFPQAKREKDLIIQIGTTYTYLGESTPYRQHIVCLRKTDDLEGIIVESYDTEKEVIEAWREEIIRADADIITGYNIFHFDEKYIRDRCTNFLYDDEDDMLIDKLSKLKDKVCRFREIKLASSALGDNELRFWNTPGRVHIDLMKDVQKTYKLSSYRLDFVSSNFIRGQIKSIKKKGNKYKLYCNNVNDIFKEDYIHIEIIKGFVSDFVGKKYFVKKVNFKKNILTIKSDVDLVEEIDFSSGKVYWSQAKDDVGPKDIFKKFTQTSKDRAVVAKYCVKDCRLVNLLVNKLEVVTKNIEMSNVCFVPLPYLFIRGQGIKLFSLCLKEFRENGYVFPVVQRKITFKYPVKKVYDNYIYTKYTKTYTGNIVKSPYLQGEEENEEIDPETNRPRKGKKYEYLIKFDTHNLKRYLAGNNQRRSRGYKNKVQSLNKYQVEILKRDGYEGAIVFDPVPEVQYEALTTKDFASLYPSSIMQKNMSHETLVENEKYDNLPDVKYYNAYFRENDGHIEWRRFAKKNNELGVVPKILNKLLSERRAVKKQMKIEKDQFKYKILDAKQLALKITANSLYGQLGAATSPVCKRDIAACTTSTGREMLIYAKKYDEELLPWIINGFKFAYLKNKTDVINKIYEQELKDKTNIKIKEKIKNFVKNDILKYTLEPIIKYGDTDSVFASFGFKDGMKKVKKEESLIFWKEVIKFSRILIRPFIPEEYRFMWDELHNDNYNSNRRFWKTF